MYVVKIINDGVVTEIHNDIEKLGSGKVVKGINTIDSFTFSINPMNVGFDLLKEYKTYVKVENVNKSRTEFYGRVLSTSVEMESSGMISKTVTCESILGLLHDSQQWYVEERNWSVVGLLDHIISAHNLCVGYDEKEFKYNSGTVYNANETIFCEIPRDTSFNVLKENLLDAMGGEVRVYDDGDFFRIDYVKQIGEVKTTKIELSRNMKAITRERDPSDIVTRLIPLGAKEKDSERRLTLKGYGHEHEFKNVNIYVLDLNAEKQYGVRVGYKIWDDITDPSVLSYVASNWMHNNSRVLVKYSITTVDLFLLGLDIDDFEVGNTHPIVNPLLGIEDTARIIKKTIDILDETKSTIEIGDKFKTMSEIQRDQKKEAAASTYTKSEIVSDVIEALPTWRGGSY